jgi:hypothetical protein
VRAAPAPPKPPLHVLHLGKTGGTALKQVLLDYGAASNHELLLHGHDVTILDVPARESFMFIVRDPLSRFLSGFNGRLREDRPRYHYPWRTEEKVAFAIFTTPDQLATALSSEDEVERRQAEDAMRGIGHINTSYWYWFADETVFHSRLPDLFFIAFQDRLDEDFDLLKQKLGLPAEARMPVDELKAHRTPAGFAKELGDVARSNLERWYERDLAFVQMCREVAPTVNRGGAPSGGPIDEFTRVATSENRRLNKEVKELHARVAALESSRWWRLHPRFALARLGRRLAPEHERPARTASREPAAPASAPDPITVRFRAEVVERGHFSQDWFTVHIAAWEPVVRDLEGRASRLLELGSFEGMSACFLLWRLPEAELTAIDTFTGLREHPAYGISTSELEDTFDRNVALVDASRVRKLVGSTHHLLPDLIDEGRLFDLVYVDAAHRSLDVIADAALSWQLLSPDGIAIFDDYGAVPVQADPMLRPTPALDAFAGLVAGQADIVSKQRQLMLRKKA